MIDQTDLAQVFYQSWHDYQSLLIKAIAPLSDEQLALSAAPGLRSIGDIARHMIGARSRWFHDLIGGRDERFDAMGRWDRRDMPARSAAELVDGLETTWRVMEQARARWSPAEWDQTYEGEDGEPPTYNRRWILWHLIEHDIHHGGEISLTLGAHGLAAPSL